MAPVDWIDKQKNELNEVTLREQQMRHTAEMLIENLGAVAQAEKEQVRTIEEVIANETELKTSWFPPKV